MAIVAAPSETPENPKKAAIIAMIKNVTVQRNIIINLGLKDNLRIQFQVQILLNLIFVCTHKNTFIICCMKISCRKYKSIEFIVKFCECIH